MTVFIACRHPSTADASLPVIICLRSTTAVSSTVAVAPLSLLLHCMFDLRLCFDCERIPSASIDTELSALPSSVILRSAYLQRLTAAFLLFLSVASFSRLVCVCSSSLSCTSYHSPAGCAAASPISPIYRHSSVFLSYLFPVYGARVDSSITSDTQWTRLIPYDHLSSPKLLTKPHPIRVSIDGAARVCASSYTTFLHQ